MNELILIETEDGAMDVAAEQAVKERPPHPGPLVWVDATPEVRELAEKGMTVEAIARTTRLTRLQVNEVLDRFGYRRLHDAPKKTGRRTFDRAAARAAYDAGESRASIAARLGVSIASVSVAVKEVRW